MQRDLFNDKKWINNKFSDNQFDNLITTLEFHGFVDICDHAECQTQ